LTFRPAPAWLGMTDRSPSPRPPSILSTPVDLSTPVTSAKGGESVRVFRDVLLLTEGRDKVVKLLQYASRLLLLLSVAPTKRLRPFISQMSMTRKVIKLGHGIYPYLELGQKLETLARIRAWIEFVNDFWDDVYCLSRIGVIRNAAIQRLSEDWANRAWMLGILMDLHALLEKRATLRQSTVPAVHGASLKVQLQVNDVQKTGVNLQTELFWLDVSIAKLLADFGFCGMSMSDIPLTIAIDVFDFHVHEGYQSVLGFASALMRYVLDGMFDLLS